MSDRCYKCVSVVEIGQNFCNPCFDLITRFSRMNLCWNCAADVTGVLAVENYCHECGVPFRHTPPLFEQPAAEEHGDDVLAAVANPEEVPMGLPCRGDTQPYEMPKPFAKEPAPFPPADLELPPTDVIPVASTERKIPPLFPAFGQRLRDRFLRTKPAS